jgi:hypothetical protein
VDHQVEEVSLKLRRYLYQLAEVLGDQRLGDAADHISNLESRLAEAEYALEIQNGAKAAATGTELIEEFRALVQKRPLADPIPLEPRAGPMARQLMQEATLRPRGGRHDALSKLGDASLLAFFILVEEAEEWGGEPCVGTSEAPGLKGALPHLKRAGLLTTYTKEDGSQRGTGTYVRFTSHADEVLDQLRAGT